MSYQLSTLLHSGVVTSVSLEEKRVWLNHTPYHALPEVCRAALAWQSWTAHNDQFRNQSIYFSVGLDSAGTEVLLSIELPGEVALLTGVSPRHVRWNDSSDFGPLLTYSEHVGGYVVWEAGLWPGVAPRSTAEEDLVVHTCGPLQCVTRRSPILEALSPRVTRVKLTNLPGRPLRLVSSAQGTVLPIAEYLVDFLQEAERAGYRNFYAVVDTTGCVSAIRVAMDVGRPSVDERTLHVACMDDLLNSGLVLPSAHSTTLRIYSGLELVMYERMGRYGLVHSVQQPRVAVARQAKLTGLVKEIRKSERGYMLRIVANTSGMRYLNDVVAPADGSAKVGDLVACEFDEAGRVSSWTVVLASESATSVELLRNLLHSEPEWQDTPTLRTRLHQALLFAEGERTALERARRGRAVQSYAEIAEF